MGIIPSAPIVYQEFDGNGLPTGRVVSGYSAQNEGLKGFAETELKNSWISDVYPNAEYAKLYADGNYTGRVFATGRDGKDLVEYRDVDFMWEAAAPYKIYSIKQAKLNFNGTAKWFGSIEKNYPVEYTQRNAAVSVERVKYGFGDYEVIGNNKITFVPDIIKYAYMDQEAYGLMRGVTPAQLAVSVVAPTPVEVDKNAAIQVPRTYDLKLTGPAFDNDGNQIANGLTIYGSKDQTPSKFNVKNLLTTIKDNDGLTSYCDITWTAGGYESERPYRVYEYLTIDGVIMDGSKIDAVHYKPCIFRYTGATANLKHRTVVAGVSANGEVLLKTQVSFNEGYTYVDEGYAYGTGIYPNVEYNVEKVYYDGQKTVTAVYKFKYNDVLYDLYEINGEWICEIWGNNIITTNLPHYFLEPYVD